MAKKILDHCVYDKDGNQWNFHSSLPSGAFVYINEVETLLKVNRYGQRLSDNKQILFNQPQETVEFLTLYPNGNVYHKSCCPVSTSSYGVENLIQIKVTRRDDKIVRKEFC